MIYISSKSSWHAEGVFMFLMTSDFIFSHQSLSGYFFRINETCIHTCKVILPAENNMFDLQITV